MTRSAAAAAGHTPLDDVALAGVIARAAAGETGPVRLVGAGLHGLAAQLISDGVPVEATVSGRRDGRAFRRAARHAGRTVAVPVIRDVRIDLPFPDAGLDVIVCRLDPRTFPFPRRTVRELGRAVAPGGMVVVLAGDRMPWPAGLVDAWAVSAGLVPRDDRSIGGALRFAGAVYESRS
jgi:SAM-dependent methyltransferase